MKLPPKRRDENIVTPTMTRTMFITASYFIVVMLSLLVAMKYGFLRGPGPIIGAFTILQVTLFFTIYVYFQVWNQINCRSLTPDSSGFSRILENPTFVVIAGAVALGQIVIVTFGGPVFNVEPLSLWHWLGVIAFTSTVLIFVEIARRVRLSMAER
jgi:Ca2+-transporting ATPase